MDAATSLRGVCHVEAIYTSHHDPSHCFAETIDGTVRVRQFGRWIPRTLFGQCTVLMSILRVLYVTLALVWHLRLWRGGLATIDAVVLDQVPVGILVLRLLTRCKVCVDVRIETR